MITLLDLNVLLALAWPNHEHHSRALRWFRQQQPKGWATCPLTQSGFVRISSNSRIFPEARSPGEAGAWLGELVGLPGHQFWPDEIRLTESPHIAWSRIHGHRQVTDAHLLALALHHGGALATFDRALRTLVPPNADPEVAVVLLD